MFDLVTIGHFSIDFIIPLSGGKPRRRLGGPPAYTSISAIKLGAIVSVVSRSGGDFPETYLKLLMRNGVDLSRLRIDEASKTTSFLIRYRADGERDMFLKSRAQLISTEDIEGLEAKVVHISPIANEVPITLIKEVAEMVPTVSLDPQGLLRQFDDEGRVILRGIDDLNFLKHINIFKASESEIKALTGLGDVLRALEKINRVFGVEVAMATISRDGTLVSFNKGVFYIPAAQPKRLIDPTGAGDSFMGGFLAEYIRGKEDILWCASVGSSAASYVIEEIGPKGFKGGKKVYERARLVYEKIVKIAT
ncbi:MAG: carbohydrate kinase family protein [Candidatus Bathyarchaeia archaeon]